MSEINNLNGRKWTSATEEFQEHSEAVQTARGTVQAAYEAAKGHNGGAPNPALVAAIESEASQRQNRQQGAHIVPTVPTVAP